MAGESQKTKQMKERKSLKAFLNNICILDTFQIFESQAYGADEMAQCVRLLAAKSLDPSLTIRNYMMEGEK